MSLELTLFVSRSLQPQSIGLSVTDVMFCPRPSALPGTCPAPELAVGNGADAHSCYLYEFTSVQVEINCYVEVHVYSI